MDFTYRVDVGTDIDATIEAVTGALQDQGFGILTRIDVHDTLKQKLDVDVEPEVILGACNPQLAHRALQVEARVATLLPCNVVVRTENGRTVVEALDPKLIAEIPDNDQLHPIADDAGRRIRAALDALVSG